MAYIFFKPINSMIIFFFYKKSIIYRCHHPNKTASIQPDNKERNRQAWLRARRTLYTICLCTECTQKNQNLIYDTENSKQTSEAITQVAEEMRVNAITVCRQRKIFTCTFFLQKQQIAPPHSKYLHTHTRLHIFTCLMHMKICVVHFDLVSAHLPAHGLWQSTAGGETSF